MIIMAAVMMMMMARLTFCSAVVEVEERQLDGWRESR